MYEYCLTLGLQTSRVDIKPLPETYYQHGPRDGVNVLFYSLVWIILHALAQEYIWEVGGAWGLGKWMGRLAEGVAC